MQRGGRGARAWRATAYLLSMLATAVVTVLTLPVLCHPALRERWARWHQTRAGRLRGTPWVPCRPPLGRFFGWAAVQVGTAVPLGLVALLALGNLTIAAVVTPLWWAFPPDDRPRLLIEVPVAGWATALTLGLAQLLMLAGVVGWGLPPLAGLHARATLALLAPSPSERLAVRVAELTRTRTDVLEAHSAELRRIERDLHDGTQARLVAIATRLAVVRDALPAGWPPLVDRALREAHEYTEAAMVELRDVLRGIYPPILADLGLPGALRTVAARSGVPTATDLADVGPVPATVEAVAYFAVTEALTNIAKHSRATEAAIRLHRTEDRLTVSIWDNGVGGAADSMDAAVGASTGLAGIRRRAHALDGAVSVTSPPGGPTTITVELPCG